jgi:hypothetical protein
MPRFVFPNEYDIGEINERLYLEVLDVRRNWLVPGMGAIATS